MKTGKKYIEVIWYGRGGQGAITASQLIAESAYEEGYRGVTTAPSFGAERRGAPVAAFLRLSHEPIRIFSQIDKPDIIVVLDPTLLPVLDLPNNFSHDTVLVINSTETPDTLGLGSFQKIGIADSTSTALENNLTLAGVAILNTPILGAFVKTTELVALDTVKKFIEKKFSPEKAALNFNTAEMTFAATTLYTK